MDFRYGDPVLGSGAGATEDPPLFCLACGYDLRGMASGRCPECGHAFVLNDWRREVAAVQSRMRDLDEALRWIPVGWKVVTVGVALRLFGFAPGVTGMGDLLIRGATFVCGFVGFFLGANIWRIRTLPAWARDRLTTQPNYMGATMSIAGGSLLLIVAVVLP